MMIKRTDPHCIEATPTFSPDSTTKKKEKGGAINQKKKYQITLTIVPMT
jgi:hypothetical protein